jgi:hypothetical protein
VDWERREYSWSKGRGIHEVGGRRRRIDGLGSDVEGRGVNVVGRLVIGMENHLYLYPEV